MTTSRQIELPGGEIIPILYADRSVLALDKPRGWMLAPAAWQSARDLQAALAASIAAREFWARSRNLKFLRFVHRLDADTTGVLLFAKSRGAIRPYSQLFESRGMEKIYLAVVHGAPKQTHWRCRLKLSPDPRKRGKMKTDPRGKPAETQFRLLRAGPATSLIEARPLTGRTHQIRVHLAAAGLPVVGDALYGLADGQALALRAIALSYHDPFTRRRVEIRAPAEPFCRKHGFEPPPELSGEAGANRAV